MIETLTDNIYDLYLTLKYRRKKYPESPLTILKMLLESQWWPREKIRKYQLERLNDLVGHSKENVRFYSKWYDGLRLPLTSLRDFREQVPIIKKTDIIENRIDFQGSRYTEGYEHTTSGSSGDPLVTYISGMADAHRKAAVLRFHDTWGIKEKDKSVLIWRGNMDGRKSVFRWLKESMKRTLVVDVFSLNRNTILDNFNKIEKYKPKYIRGYRSGMMELAELMELNKLRFKSFKLDLVIVTAEVMVESDRTFMEEIFGCKVVNEYGSADAGFFAYECPKGSMHINEESVYIHTDDEDLAIITELYNDSMPYINYLNDDVVKISNAQCECGRTSRIITEIVGRESGFALRTNGTKVTQFIFMLIFHELYRFEVPDSVKKFKVFQNKNDFRIQIVPLSAYGKKCEEYIVKRMKEELGEEINIQFEMVEQVERDKSGKLRYFIREA